MAALIVTEALPRMLPEIVLDTPDLGDVDMTKRTLATSSAEQTMRACGDQSGQLRSYTTPTSSAGKLHER